MRQRLASLNIKDERFEAVLVIGVVKIGRNFYYPSFFVVVLVVFVSTGK